MRINSSSVMCLTAVDEATMPDKTMSKGPYGLIMKMTNRPNPIDQLI